MTGITATGFAATREREPPRGGFLSVNNSQFTGNSSGGFGGAIVNHGFASLNNIQVSSNSAAFGGSPT